MANDEKVVLETNFRRYMLDMCIMLIPALILSMYYYGSRPILLVGGAIITAMLTERIACAVRRKDSTLGDFSAIFTGAIIALLLPASVPLWLPAVGAGFAILVAKIPFGSALKTPFLPAAVGLAFVMVSWQVAAFTYPAPHVDIVAGASADFVSSPSVAHMLQNGVSLTPNWYSVINLLVGAVPGPMGATSLLIVFGMLAYQGIRRPKSFLITFSYLAVCAVMALLFPRVLSGRIMSLIMELSSGFIFFTAMFLLPSPPNAPRSTLGRIIYGAVGGFFTMILRYIGAFEDGAIFAVLLLNAAWPAFQHIASNEFVRKKTGTLIVKREDMSGISIARKKRLEKLRLTQHVTNLDDEAEEIGE